MARFTVCLALVAIALCLQGAAAEDSPKPWYCLKAFTLSVPQDQLQVKASDFSWGSSLAFSSPLYYKGVNAATLTGAGIISDVQDAGISSTSFVQIVPVNGLGSISVQGTTQSIVGATSLLSIVGGAGIYRSATGVVKVLVSDTDVVYTISMDQDPRCKL